MTRSKLALILAAGTTASMALSAAAQPVVVNISGATLLENFFRARASTIDFIDVDGNGVARGYPGAFEAQVQQLAPFALPQAFPANQTWASNQWWSVMNSSVGSTNGYQELIDHGRSFVTNPGTVTVASTSLRINARTAAIYNRYRFILAGAGNDDGLANPEVPDTFGPIFNNQNPMGAPIRAVITPGPSQFRSLYTSIGTPSTQPNQGLTQDGGMTVDIAPLDVPTTWATTQTGTGPFDGNPLGVGYGNNAGNPVDADGTRRQTGSRQTTLATLTGGANLFGLGPTTSNTIFDTALVHAAVAPVATFGVGLTQIDMTELRQLFSIGRLTDGENIVAVTRDSGSGTRNAWDNSIGLDPSFANGDNTGVRNNGPQFDRMGPLYIPSNKQGNNRVEEATQNNRLAIGYVGPERGVEQGWLINGRMEVLAVRNNFSYGGTQYVRPTLNNQLDNGANGWVIWGPSVLATFGDPLSAPANKGGLGWLEPWTDANANSIVDAGEFTDLNNNGVRDEAYEVRPGTLNPAMRNVEAAAYVNNISRSIRAFVAAPGSDNTTFTPGEFGATGFVLLGAVDFVKQTTPSIDPVVNVANPNFNQALQDFIRNSGNVYNNVAYTQFGRSVQPFTSNSRAGRVPLRSTYLQNNPTVASERTSLSALVGVDAFVFANNFQYSDAALVPAGDRYITQDGTLLTYTDQLPLRNTVSGDFNADGVRDINDAANLVSAWRSRNGGPAWVSPAASGALAGLAVSTGGDASPGKASIEILGDFNGDGSFTRQDVRYFADGLAAVVDGSSPTGRRIDRKAGFNAVDSAFGGNFFGTVLATAKPYVNGDSRGDVYNSAGRVTPGGAPVGADGGVRGSTSFPAVAPQTTASTAELAAALRDRVDGWDITYVQAQFLRNTAVTDGALNWSNIAEANGRVSVANLVHRADLSADMTGDLVINQADVVELVQRVLKTNLKDVNLDGVVDVNDFNIVNNSIATPPAPANVFWSTGDLTGDGLINTADLNAIRCGLADIAGPGPTAGADGELTADDVIFFIGRFTANDVLVADIAGPGPTEGADGELTADDIILFINRFTAGCFN
jgi:hypothetical protein